MSEPMDLETAEDCVTIFGPDVIAFAKEVRALDQVAVHARAYDKYGRRAIKVIRHIEELATLPHSSYPTPEGERIITTAPMSLERAREILVEANLITGGFPTPIERAMMPDGRIFLRSCPPLTADQLEALAVWMRAHAK